MSGSFLPSLGRRTTTVYSGRGAGIVMESNGFHASCSGVYHFSRLCNLTRQSPRGGSIPAPQLTIQSLLAGYRFQPGCSHRVAPRSLVEGNTIIVASSGNQHNTHAAKQPMLNSYFSVSCADIALVATGGTEFLPPIAAKISSVIFQV